MERSRGILSIKIINGLVGKNPQYVTITCSYCHIKGKLIDVGKRLGLQDGLLTDCMDDILITKGTWKSLKNLWDPCLRTDVLSLAFTYRRYPDKNCHFSEFGKKSFLTITSLGWTLKMSLVLDEPNYTYSHQHTRHFKREACYGGTVGANKQVFRSTLHTEILEIIQKHLKSNSQEICKLKHEYRKDERVFREKYGIENEKMTVADEDYRIFIKKRKRGSYQQKIS